MEKILAYTVSFLVASLILRQLYQCFTKERIIEGATGDNNSDDVSEYKDPDMSQDPLYLATLNAANISWLKGQFDTINDLSTKIDAMNKQVESNSSAVQSLSEATAAPANDIPDEQTTSDLAATGDTIAPGAE
jgi:hypothetical protein